MLSDWVKGDIVFFASNNSAHSLEYVAEIEEVNTDNLYIRVKNCIAIMKMLNSNGQMGYESINNLGLISNMSSLENGENGILTIDMANFSVYGKVKNMQVLKLFENEKSNLILLGNQKPTAILG